MHRAAGVICSCHSMIYIPGDCVCITGAYEALHSGHRPPHQVWLRAEEKFPHCRHCGSNVLFKFACRATEPTCDHISADQDFVDLIAEA